MNQEPVVLTTSDHVVLKGDFFPVNPKKVVILVHPFNRDRSVFGALTRALVANGFSVLSFDWRGHGESRAQGFLANPQSLLPNDFLNIEKDLDAAVAFLREKGFEAFFLVGGSIGANWAIMYPARHPGFFGSVALSPGLDFKGLKPKADAAKTRVPLLVISSADDPYSLSSSKELVGVVTSEKEFVRLKTGGHATALLDGQPELIPKIVEWIFNR